MPNNYLRIIIGYITMYLFCFVFHLDLENFVK